MTKKKIFLTCGAFVLAIASFLATKATKKIQTQTAYFNDGSGNFVTLFKGQNASVLHLTTVAPSPTTTAFFKTKGMANPRTLFSNQGLSTKLYYK